MFYFYKLLLFQIKIHLKKFLSLDLFLSYGHFSTKKEIRENSITNWFLMFGERISTFELVAPKST